MKRVLAEYLISEDRTIDLKKETFNRVGGQF